MDFIADSWMVLTFLAISLKKDISLFIKNLNY